MKKDILALMLLVLIIAVGIYEEIVFTNTLNKVKDYTFTLEKQIEQNDNDSMNTCTALNDFWDKNNSFMEVVFYNPNIKNVSLDIYEILGALEADDFKSAEARVYVLRKRIDSLKETMCFSLISII